MTYADFTPNHMLAMDFPGARLQHKDLRMNAELERVIERATEPQPRLSKQVETLSDQLQKVEAINAALRERISAERMRAHHEHELRCAETQQAFDRRIADVVTRLEGERRDEMRRLQDDFHEAMREIERVSKRLDE